MFIGLVAVLIAAAIAVFEVGRRRKWWGQIPEDQLDSWEAYLAADNELGEEEYLRIVLLMPNRLRGEYNRKLRAFRKPLMIRAIKAERVRRLMNDGKHLSEADTEIAQTEGLINTGEPRRRDTFESESEETENR